MYKRINMKYKIYEIIKNQKTDTVEFKEFFYDGHDWTFDTPEEAYEAIKREGFDYTQYSILPYVYMTKYQ